MAIEEQVRAYGGPQFQVTQQVMNRFAEAIQQAGVDVVPRILIGGGDGDGHAGTGSIMEALMAMLLSERMGAAAGQAEPALAGGRSPAPPDPRPAFRDA